MTEQSAKLTVKVKLHAAQPVVLPTTVPPAPLSKLKVFLGVLVLVLLTAAGYLFSQQFIGKVPSAIAADHDSQTDIAPIDSDDAAETPALNTTQLADVTPSADPDTLPAEVAVAELSTAELSTEEQSAAEVSQNLAVAESAVVATNTKTVPSAVTAAAVTESTQSTQPTQPTMAQVLSASGRTLPEGFSRIVLAATMEQLEPGAAIDKLVAQQQIQRLYLFTELNGYAGQQLIHRWSFAGQVQTEALLTIEDSPWRTYSEKWLLPDQLGSWRVEIVDQQQQVLYQHDFLYQ